MRTTSSVWCLLFCNGIVFFLRPDRLLVGVHFIEVVGYIRQGNRTFLCLKLYRSEKFGINLLVIFVLTPV